MLFFCNNLTARSSLHCKMVIQTVIINKLETKNNVECPVHLNVMSAVILLIKSAPHMTLLHPAEGFRSGN